MGMYRNTYVGVFMHVSEGGTREIKEKRKVCVNASCIRCNQEAKGKFCNNCGTKVESVTFTHEQRVTVNDFMNDTDYEYEDVVYAPGCAGDLDVLIPNCNLGPEHKLIEIDDYDEESVTVFDDDLIQSLKAEAFVNSRFLQALYALYEYFGKDNVKVCVGVVRYVS